MKLIVMKQIDNPKTPGRTKVLYHYFWFELGRKPGTLENQSIDTLADSFKTSRRAIRKHLKQLEDLKLVVRHGSLRGKFALQVLAPR